MSAPENAQGTVLIVDDTPANLALLSDTLSEAGYRVLVATDGLSAVEQIRYLLPDIILLDVMMPGIDGFETCKRLKSGAASDIPVLFMTGLNELENLLRGFEEGALDYIVKPIRPLEVLARIDVHLGQSRQLRRTQRLLFDSAFFALALDALGSVRWLTPSADSWLRQLAVPLEASWLNAPLPAPLLAAALDAITHIATDGQAAQALPPIGGRALLLDGCEQPGQFLLLDAASHAGTATAVDPLNPEMLKTQLKLTFREAEILMWIARGKTNKEIGQILNTSPRTVNKHLEHVFEKLGVCTRSAAVGKMLDTVGRTA